LTTRSQINLPISKVTLNGFKFVYDGTSKDGGTVGNVVSNKDEEVCGGLYEINVGRLRSLDKYEGYPTSYNRQEFIVQSEKGKKYSALACFRTGKQVGEPLPEYRQIVFQGAKDCRLPTEYIHEYL
jgi:gamma-glutamylcyclotransferase (GGCT)/AIG2-like uncharacterized protein YtfP